MITTTQAVVQDIRSISDTLRLFTLSVNRIQPWEPGMFLQLALGPLDRTKPWPNSRAFSIACWGSDNLRVLVRKEGIFTARLFRELKVGSVLSLRYPYGNFLLNQPGPKCFLAGGAGVSVFISYLDFARLGMDNSQVYLIHSVARPEESIQNIFGEEVPPNITVKVKVTRRYSDKPPGGRITMDDLSCGFRNWGEMSYFVCGPAQFTQNITNMLRKSGVDKLFSDNWKSQRVDI